MPLLTLYLSYCITINLRLDQAIREIIAGNWWQETPILSSYFTQGAQIIGHPATHILFVFALSLSLHPFWFIFLPQIQLVTRWALPNLLLWKFLPYSFLLNSFEVVGLLFEAVFHLVLSLILAYLEAYHVSWKEAYNDTALFIVQ